MKYAVINLKGQAEEVVAYAIEIAKGYYKIDEIEAIKCPYCGAIADFCNGQIKDPYFRAIHKEGCKNITDKRKHKEHITSTGTIIDLDEIMNHIDSTSNNKGHNGGDDGPTGVFRPKTPQGEIDDIDQVIKFRPNHICSASRLLSYIKNEGLNAEISKELKAEDILLTESKISRLKFETTKKCVYFALSSRMKPGELKSKIEIPYNYLCLKDAFSADQEKAIIFQVTFDNDVVREEFVKKLIGTKENNFEDRSPKNCVAILAEWVLIPHKKYIIYRAKICSKSYVFYNSK